MTQRRKSRKLKKFTKQEVRKLRLKTIRIRGRVEEILRNDYHRRLFRMKQQDELRLLILAQWEQKYKVSLSYILETILPYWHKRLAKTARSKNGLGVRVTSLIGKISEKLLKDRIAEDFPGDEHKQEAKWERRRFLIQRRSGKLEMDSDLDFPVTIRKKTLLDYKSPKQFVRSYRKRITSARKEFDLAVADKKNRRRPYRDSPWF